MAAHHEGAYLSDIMDVFKRIGLRAAPSQPACHRRWFQIHPQAQETCGIPSSALKSLHRRESRLHQQHQFVAQARAVVEVRHAAAVSPGHEGARPSAAAVMRNVCWNSRLRAATSPGIPTVSSSRSLPYKEAQESFVLSLTSILPNERHPTGSLATIPIGVNVKKYVRRERTRAS